MEKTGFCDVGCGDFFGESAAECEYAANFTDVNIGMVCYI